jgi:hypothetical protein
MKLVAVEDCVVIKAEALKREAIRLGQRAELLKAVSSRLAGREEDSVYHRGGIADRSENVAIAL